MVEIELTHKEVELLMASLPQAQDRFTDRGDFKASTAVSKLRENLHRQIFTYGQMED